MALFLSHRQKQLLIMGALARSQPRTAFDVSNATSLSAGSVYPTLIELETVGLVRSIWAEGVPPRARLYSLVNRSPEDRSE